MSTFRNIKDGLNQVFKDIAGNYGEGNSFKIIEPKQVSAFSDRTTEPPPRVAMIKYVDLQGNKHEKIMDFSALNERVKTFDGHELNDTMRMFKDARDALERSLNSIGHYNGAKLDALNTKSRPLPGANA